MCVTRDPCLCVLRVILADVCYVLRRSLLMRVLHVILAYICNAYYA